MSTIRLTSPHMHGNAVRALQRHVNSHLHKWGVPEYALMPVDGSYGELSRVRTLEVCHGLGISSHATEHGIGPGTQRKLAYADRYLTPAEKKLRDARHDWKKRLAHRLAGSHEHQAVEFALKMAKLHITEQPPGSNLGPYITAWERMAGYRVPPGVFWCGCFVNACLVAGGLHSHASMGIGYVPNIEAYAHAGREGWAWHSPQTEPRAGWIATFGEPIAEHTEFVVGDGFPLRTVGGNTSAGDGSPNNGGGVFHHNFSTYHGLPLRGFAAPRYN